MSTVRVVALRGVVAGVGRELQAGSEGDVDAVEAAVLLDMGAVRLADERDARAVSDAVKARDARMRHEVARDGALFRASR